MAGLVSDPVTVELRRWASEPFGLADDNCGLAVLAYVERALSTPAPAWLSVRLFGRRAARKMIRDRRAFIDASLLAMQQLGCAPTENPLRGDGGLVDLDGSGLTACICLGNNRWAARGDRAVVIQSAESVFAWRVPCPRR